jgi:transcriptional regulator with XRE-family HTH domain
MVVGNLGIVALQAMDWMVDMPDQAPLISRRLKELREAAGMSQQALAMAAGVSISVVAQIEQGAKSDPRLSTLLALSKALGVDVAQLAVGEEGAPSKKAAGRPPKATPPTPPAEDLEATEKKPRSRRGKKD